VTKRGSSKYDYDLLIIGCGPAGQRAAVQAAKIRKRVAIIDHREVVGGVCVNSGTIPSKSFKEAVLFLSGYRQRSIYGAGYRVKTDIEDRCYSPPVKTKQNRRHTRTWTTHRRSHHRG
jgi:pyruvate/2-oxoglutarate dehydrogenase complex dihydrolipoamide dehydrogenase (E3) component